MQDRDFEQLIQTITDLVMARLQSIANLSEMARTLTVLWPVASSMRNHIMAGISAFRHDHKNIQWIIKDDLLTEVKNLLPADERSNCYSITQAPVQSILGKMQTSDVMLVAAANFQAAKQIISMNDEIPWVHVLLQAHLSGQHIIICEDLLSPAGLKDQNPVALEAASLKRDLKTMGFTLVRAKELTDYFKDLTSTVNFGTSEKATLVTERDVEDMYRAGHKELRLHAKTLVTPLAQSKATELGLNLIRVQAQGE